MIIIGQQQFYLVINHHPALHSPLPPLLSSVGECSAAIPPLPVYDPFRRRPCIPLFRTPFLVNISCCVLLHILHVGPRELGVKTPGDGSSRSKSFSLPRASISRVIPVSGPGWGWKLLTELNHALLFHFPFATFVLAAVVKGGRRGQVGVLEA